MLSEFLIVLGMNLAVLLLQSPIARTFLREKLADLRRGNKPDWAAIERMNFSAADIAQAKTAVGGLSTPAPTGSRLKARFDREEAEEAAQ